VFGPWMLKDASVAKDLWRINDFAADALPMRLASANTIAKLINADYADVGNCAVTTLFLAFMRLQSYAVNS